MDVEKNEDAPCIKVSPSTNEMSQILESGNSLEVVFNNDLMARKSGGNKTIEKITGFNGSVRLFFSCFYV